MPKPSRIEDVLARFPGPVTLRASRRKWLLVLLLCAAFTAGGVWMTSEDQTGWFVVGVFGLGTVTAAIALLPGAGELKLDYDRFEMCSLYRRGSVRWRDADGFTAARIPASSHVMVAFDDATVSERTLAKVNVGLVGRNSGLPDTYGLSAESLADLMTRWRERAIST